MGRVSIACSDVRDWLTDQPDSSAHAILCDPPYGLSDHDLKSVQECCLSWAFGEPYAPDKLGFMGRAWDAWPPGPEVWREALRVLKPGGYLLAFAGTRSMDLMTLAIRLGGFEIRDALAWLHGQGFPKNRKVTLKPAWEPIILARKPMIGSVDANLAQHGCGSLAIDACRIPLAGGEEAVEREGETSQDSRYDGVISLAAKPGRRIGSPAWGGPNKTLSGAPGQEGRTVPRTPPADGGRWPANVLHDGSQVVIDELADSSRFFYCAKPTKADRDFGLDHAEEKSVVTFQTANGTSGAASSLSAGRDTKYRNNHPTVKNTALTEWLARLVLPPAGDEPRRLLVPFSGSGSEMIGAIRAGWDVVLGCEMNPEYVEMAKARCAAAISQKSQTLFNVA